MVNAPGRVPMTLPHVPPPDPPASALLLVAPLAVAQLVSWGSLFYAFALFVAPMQAELGWSKPAITAAFSLGLGAAALAAVPVGRLVDAGHGRLTMTVGSLLAACLLALWSKIASYPAFLVLWAALGVAMSAVLYEPAFAVLSLSLGARARRAITATALVGGFASTVFVPFTHLLVERLGWRDALLALAGANLAVCALIHLLVIPRPRLGSPRSEAPASSGEGATRVLRQAAFWGFVTTSVAHGLLATGLAVHLVPLLVARGFTLDQAVAAFAMIGPAQVAARVALALGERRLGLRLIGLVTTALPVAAFALLPLATPGSWGVAVCVALYGASNGMMTMVRALLPIDLFGRADYGAIQGMLALPFSLARAAAPFAFAALWAWSGRTGVVVAGLFAVSCLALISFTLTLIAAPRTASPP